MAKIRTVAVAVAAMGLMSLGGAGNALALSLSLTDIAGFSMLSSSDPATVTINNGIVPDGTAVTITSIFAPPQSGAQSVSVGLAGLSAAYVGGDSLSLYLGNFNENAWSYQLVADTTEGTFTSSVLSIVPGSGALFSAALSGTAGTLTSAYFIISANVPFPDGDRTAEYHIGPAPVPIPPAIALFGGGLFGLGLLSRGSRKRSRSISDQAGA